MGKADALEKSARKGDHLEPDESAREVAVVGFREFMPGVEVRGSLGKRCALVATDRNVYVMTLGQVGLRSVKGVAVKIPIGEAQISREKGNKISVGRRGGEPELILDLPPAARFGAATPKRVIAHVEAHGGHGGAPPTTS